MLNIFAIQENSVGFKLQERKQVIIAILRTGKPTGQEGVCYRGLVLPEACLLMVLEHTSYVPSGTTQAFITGSSPGSGFQSSQDVSKSSANLRQQSGCMCNRILYTGSFHIDEK